ncbi:hypothetical protein HK100_010147 [Physocladia obscura]|uniref:Protein-S-isoprenylcysteine O-methyltransferase n=1 Tax=Physocladia obscura TaxID=109957 RepID=A0AAD5T3G3_9FUNG|nr:hypothetical protein HK100_010147 [Physocladia obscura]
MTERKANPVENRKNLWGKLREPHSHAQVASISVGLGAAIGLGVGAAIWASQPFRLIGLYIAFLGLFHFLEYLTTAMHRHDVGINSFVLDHSPQYHFAMAFGFVEYYIEAFFWPEFKQLDWITLPAVAIVLFFQIIRSLAMVTAGANFTHLIAFKKEDNHVLVTDGIYK